MHEARQDSFANDPAPTRLPGWILAAPAETLEDVAFLSGSCLAFLHHVEGNAEIPHALWRARLALAAAEVCVAISGRRETASALRDALHLLRPGDHPGPAGEMFRHWSRAVERPLVAGHLTLPAVRGGGPVEVAASVLEAVLEEAPRNEAGALILADAVLARALGWGHVVPLLGVGAKGRDLRLRGEELRLACHRAVVVAIRRAVPLAADLARRALLLRAVVPKLRAKGAAGGVALFLARDALAPVALCEAAGGAMSNRAARRLCERLVELGALRELTGRETFRLYGV